MLRFQGRDKQNRFNRIFSTTWSGKYYIVPLQVHSDSQITQRSDLEKYGGVLFALLPIPFSNTPRRHQAGVQGSPYGPRLQRLPQAHQKAPGQA